MLQNYCPRHARSTFSNSFHQEYEAKMATSTNPRCEHLERGREEVTLHGRGNGSVEMHQGRRGVVPTAGQWNRRQETAPVKGGRCRRWRWWRRGAGVAEVVEWPLHPVPSPYKKKWNRLGRIIRSDGSDYPICPHIRLSDLNHRIIRPD